MRGTMASTTSGKWTELVHLPDDNDRRYLDEARIAWRAARVLRDEPGRTNFVFDLLENFPVRDILRWHNRRLPFLRDPRLLEMFERRSMPDLTNAGVSRLRELPDGTLGREFARFFEARQLDNLFLEYLTIDSPEHWFIYRMGHLHDLFHYLLGYDPYDPIGEMEVEAFLHAQSGAANHLLFLAGYVRFLLRNDPGLLWRGRHRLRAAADLGRRTTPFLLVAWEELMPLPLDEVRRRLGIEERSPCPATVRPQAKVTPRLAHVVYNVTDLDRAVAFYTRIYGYQLAAHDRSLGVTFLTAGDDHHTIALQECLSLHPLKILPGIAGGLRRLRTLLRTRHSAATSPATGRTRVLPPLAIILGSLRPGLNHVGYRVQNETELRAYIELLRARAIPIVWAVNHGDMIKGVYFKDPAGNLCELFVDGAKARELKARLDAGEPLTAVQQDDLPTYELDLDSEIPANLA